MIDLKEEMYKRSLHKIFSPHCAMTTQVARFGQSGQKAIKSWFIRTQPGVDGGMVTRPNIALALFNADCPVIIMFDRNRGHLIMLHAGLRCLIPEDTDKPGIISDDNFKSLKIDRSAVEVFIGYGAGSCCYGVNHLMKELNTPTYQPFLYKAWKGARKGQNSINLRTLAAHQLRKSGISGAITIDHTCTACFGRNDSGGGKFYSNIYEGQDTGRNLVLAWFR